MSPPGAGVLELVSTWDASTIPGLSYPSGMDIAPDGSLYVVNGGAGEILVLDTDGSVMRRFGEPGSGDGQLDFVRDKSDRAAPIGGVTVATDGSIYVADAGQSSRPAVRRRGRVRPAMGRVRSSARPRARSSTRSTSRPRPMARSTSWTTSAMTSSGSAPMAPSSRRSGEHGTGGRGAELHRRRSSWTRRARSTTPTGRTTASRRGGRTAASSGHWVATADGPGELTLPADVAVDGAGNIYVADRHRVQVFGPDRAYIGEWLAPSTTPDDELAGIAVSQDGTVFVGAPWRGQIYVLRATDTLTSP